MCFMPEENNVYLIYMIFAAVLLLLSLEDDDDAAESKILAHLHSFKDEIRIKCLFCMIYI